MNRLVLPVALALGSLPTWAVAQMSGTPSTSTPGTTGSSDQRGPMSGSGTQSMNSSSSEATTSYVQKAGAGDLYEIESSKLALQKSNNQSVKTFAQMMVDDHNKTTEQVTNAARNAGLNPQGAVMDADQQRMIQDLQAQSGAQFDRTYLMQQKMAHQMALSLHQSYAKTGDMPALRDVASKAVPIVQSHITRLKAMKIR